MVQKQLCNKWTAPKDVIWIIVNISLVGWLVCSVWLNPFVTWVTHFGVKLLLDRPRQSQTKILTKQTQVPYLTCKRNDWQRSQSGITRQSRAEIGLTRPSSGMKDRSFLFKEKKTKDTVYFFYSPLICDVCLRRHLLSAFCSKHNSK